MAARVPAVRLSSGRREPQRRELAPSLSWRAARSVSTRAEALGDAVRRHMLGRVFELLPCNFEKVDKFLWGEAAQPRGWLASPLNSKKKPLVYLGLIDGNATADASSRPPNKFGGRTRTHQTVLSARLSENQEPARRTGTPPRQRLSG